MLRIFPTKTIRNTNPERAQSYSYYFSWLILRWHQRTKKPPGDRAAVFVSQRQLKRFKRVLTLTGFEPGLRLVDHVDAAFATHNAAITMPCFERTERISDLHGSSPSLVARASAGVAGVSTSNCGPEQ
jgi:hypothetical protein